MCSARKPYTKLTRVVECNILLLNEFIGETKTTIKTPLSTEE